MKYRTRYYSFRVSCAIIRERIWRGINRRRIGTPKASGSEKGLIDENGPEQGNSPAVRIEDTYISYVHNFNIWQKRSLNKIGLAKWKSSRNNLPWFKEGTIQTILSEVMCFPVSGTVLGLAQTPEDAIQGLNQSAGKVEMYDNSRITECSDCKTVWCPRTVHKKIGHLGWSISKLISKHTKEDGMYLVEGTQNNCFSDGVSKWTFKSELGSPMHNP